jgi:pSer/pThr/pTyr-binding forkhead associated (FHA) protein
MPRLVIMKGPGIGRDHAVATECVVGRATDVDFVIEDPGASRRHLRVSRAGDGYVVEDLGSRNGTLVNGARVQRQSLTDGDQIRVGGTEIVFRQKDLLEGGNAPARKPAIAVPPVVVSAPPPTPTGPLARPAAADAPAAPEKKPLPKVVPRRRY